MEKQVTYHLEPYLTSFRKDISGCAKINSALKTYFSVSIDCDIDLKIGCSVYKRGCHHSTV